MPFSSSAETLAGIRTASAELATRSLAVRLAALRPVPRIATVARAGRVARCGSLWRGLRTPHLFRIFGGSAEIAKVLEGTAVLVLMVGTAIAVSASAIAVDQLVDLRVIAGVVTVV